MGTTEFCPIRWQGDHLQLLDQRLLPQQEIWNDYHQVDAAADAIALMVVRGAPAIGITAAYAAVLAARQYSNDQAALLAALERLAQARPTAINLHWAVAQARQLIATVADSQQWAEQLLVLAKRIHADDLAANFAMADLGCGLLAEANATSVMTHCNTGALATGGLGTALGVIRMGHRRGLIKHVYANETRPWMQGARLTAWELVREDIPCTLAVEGAAALIMQQRKPGWLIVGSDRIAANGDVANKVGTCTMAVLAKHYGVKVMVVAPTSTVDMAVASGAEIPIEARPADEVVAMAGQRIAATGPEVFNPAFDVTPAELVDAIVTERGVVLSPVENGMAPVMAEH